MFDTLLGVFGLAYNVYSGKKTDKDLDSLKVELKDTNKSILEIKNLMSSHMIAKRDLSSLAQYLIEDTDMLELISRHLFTHLTELSANTGQLPFIQFLDPRSIKYEIADPETQSFKMKKLAPCLILSPELLRLPILAPDGYGKLFVGRNKAIPFVLSNPEPAYIRQSSPIDEKNYWQEKLRDIGSNVSEEPQFFIDNDYWKARLLEIGEVNL